MSEELEGEALCRRDLAALYRLIDEHFPSTDGIYNHISIRLPERPHCFLIKPHHLLYEEVTASSLVVADTTQDCDEAAGINRPGFILHGAIQQARADVNCVVHIHSTPGIAFAARRGGLKMLSQNSVRFYRRLGYHPYEGITEFAEEGPRIAAALGEGNIAVVLENHGLAVTGGSARDAFERTRDLLIAIESQLAAEASGAPMIEIPDEVCERVSAQFAAHDAGRGAADWPAWLRHLDRIAPGYRD
jgi:ribulose-5-phosphate 4-epimerase/fuculose-1-phosphate aldolase